MTQRGESKGEGGARGSGRSQREWEEPEGGEGGARGGWGRSQRGVGERGELHAGGDV